MPLHRKGLLLGHHSTCFNIVSYAIENWNAFRTYDVLNVLLSKQFSLHFYFSTQGSKSACGAVL